MSFWWEGKDYQTDVKSYLLLVLACLIIGGGLFYSIGLTPNNSEPENLPEGSPPTEDNPVPVETRNGQKEETIIEVVEQVSPTVVSLRTEKRTEQFNIFAWEDSEQQEGQGSGIIISSDGYIVTNYHVIEEADQINVGLATKEEEYLAEVVGTDPVTDLAVIKVEPKEELPTVKFANSNQLKVGQLTIAIGNPYGFSSSVTTGVVSALDRELPLREKTELADMIQTDAPINPGNSGGALLNSKGEVIGVNTAIIEHGQGMGFAIPSNTVQEIVQELIDTGEVSRPWLGIYGAEVTSDLAREHELAVEEGIYVYRVIEDGPASDSGLSSGDIIVGLEDNLVTDMGELKDVLADYQIGDTVELSVYSDNEPEKIELELEQLPR